MKLATGLEPPTKYDAPCAKYRTGVLDRSSYSTPTANVVASETLGAGEVGEVLRSPPPVRSYGNLIIREPGIRLLECAPVLGPHDEQSVFCLRQSLVDSANTWIECLSRRVCVSCSAITACSGVRAMATLAQPRRECSIVWFIALRLNRCHSCAHRTGAAVGSVRSNTHTFLWRKKNASRRAETCCPSKCCWRSTPAVKSCSRHAH
jgi:hypothetical protein